MVLKKQASTYSFVIKSTYLFNHMKKSSLHVVAGLLTSVLFTVNTTAQIVSPAPYCELNLGNSFPVAPRGNATNGDGITNVTLNTLNHSTNGYVADSTYVYYNSVASTSLTAGNTYTISIRFGKSDNVEPEYYAAWIDFNRNNAFDANEVIINNGNSGGTAIPFGTVTTRSVQITVPANAATGITRLRVARTKQKNAAFGTAFQANYTHPPCFSLQERTAGSNAYGEVEDYNVSLSGGSVNPQAPLLAGAPATAVTATSAVLNGTVNANSNTVNVSFEYGLTTAYGATVNASPAVVSGAAATTVSANVSGLSPNTLYHVRVKGVSAGNVINYSSDGTFKTTAGSVGIEKLSADQDLLQVYPNPNAGTFTVDMERFGLGRSNENRTISLVAVDGRKVYEYITEGLSVNVNISDLPAGIYDLQVKSASGRQNNVKIVVYYK